VTERWLFDPTKTGRDYSLGYAITRESDDRTIAHVPIGPDDGASEASARLMAAAPELLELLIQLRDQWFEPHYGQNDIGMAALLRDKIRAAIAVAMEESN
jgi:hypothetical protein